MRGILSILSHSQPGAGDARAACDAARALGCPRSQAGLRLTAPREPVCGLLVALVMGLVGLGCGRYAGADSRVSGPSKKAEKARKSAFSPEAGVILSRPTDDPRAWVQSLMRLPCRPRRQGPIQPRWCVQAVQAQSFVVRSPPTSLASRGRIQPSLETASEASDSASLSQTLGTLTLSRRFRLQAARWSATLRAFQAAMRTTARPATLAAEAHGALRSALGLAVSACACARDYRNLTVVSRLCCLFAAAGGALAG
jgi:hypothetical protein